MFLSSFAEPTAYSFCVVSHLKLLPIKNVCTKNIYFVFVIKHILLFFKCILKCKLCLRDWINKIYIFNNSQYSRVEMQCEERGSK